MLVSTQANWNSSLVTSDYNLVRSDCMLVILENILVKLLVDNLNILQLVVHMMVKMVQKAVESYQGFGWFENYAQKFHTSRIYFFLEFQTKLGIYGDIGDIPPTEAGDCAGENPGENPAPLPGD